MEFTKKIIWGDLDFGLRKSGISFTKLLIELAVSIKNENL